jgi:uncharacterized phosphosugar-binding protein
MRLANVAFAYQTLSDFVTRAARAQLRGAVTLKHVAPDDGCFCATLTPLEASQSVADEHFTEEHLMDLADVVAFAVNKPGALNLEATFSIEDVSEIFLAPLRAELVEAGVTLDKAAPTLEEQNR